MIRTSLFASALIAVASVAFAGGQGDGSYSYNGTTRATTDVTKSYDSLSTFNREYGRGLSMGAGAGASVGTAASQGTTSRTGTDGHSVSVAGSGNIVATGSIAGAGAGLVGGLHTAPLFGAGAGVAGGAAGGLGGTATVGGSFAKNDSTGTGRGTAEAGQESVGQSFAFGSVDMFVTDVKETTFSNETAFSKETTFRSVEQTELDFEADVDVSDVDIEIDEVETEVRGNPGNDKSVGNAGENPNGKGGWLSGLFGRSR